jgi:hypothetical protein
VVSGISVTNGQVSIAISGDFGPDYFIQASTNLIQWQSVFTNLSATLPFYWADTAATNFSSRFYRVLLSP